MVKERKAQTGATNLTGSRGELTKTMSRGSSTGVLEAPKGMALTATWKPSKPPSRDFLTIHRETYQNPKEIKDMEPPAKTTLQIAEENMRKQSEQEAVDNLCKLVRTTHGTVGSMLRSFNKKHLDNFTLFELSEYMNRNSFQAFLPPEDQKLIFDYVEKEHDGTVLVKDFLKKVEEREFHDQEYNKDAVKLRDFISLHVKASSPMEEKVPELEAMKKQKGIENEAQLMRRALGMKTFTVDAHHEDFDEFLEEVSVRNLPKDDIQRRYARFLHHSNLKLKNIPFYENRAIELDRLKEKSVRIDLALKSDEIGGKFDQLNETRWQGSVTTNKFSEEDLLKWTVPRQYSLDNIEDDPNNPGTGLNLSMSRSMPNFATRPSPLANIEIPTPSRMPSAPASFSSPINEFDRPTSSNRIRLDAIDPKPRNLTGAAANNRSPEASPSKPKIYTKPRPKVSIESGDDLSSAGASTIYMGGHGVAESVDNQSQSTSQTNKTKATKLIDGLLESSEGILKETDFYTHVIDENSSMGRLKDPSKIMRIEKIDPNVFSTATGKRMIDKGPMDWTRVGIGGEREANFVGYGYGEDDRFLTTTSKFYPPLIYEPSQPVQRHTVSDSELAFREKAFRRQERAARTSANLDVTKTRLEYEELQKQIRSLNRQSQRIDNSIRYKTSILLNDLQHFRVQPLQRMARRQNIYLSEKNFGGSIEKQTVGLIPDSRDFMSTYKSNFINHHEGEGGGGGNHGSHNQHE